MHLPDQRPAPTAWPPQRLAPLFVLAAITLVAWSSYLVRALPAQHDARHWNVAWAGFDVALAGLLALVGATAARRSTWLEGAATAAAALLFVDAWFDVLTARTTSEVAVAAIEAAAVELPLAVLCLWLARRARRQLRLAEQSSRAAGEPSARVVTSLRPRPGEAPAGSAHPDAAVRETSERVRGNVSAGGLRPQLASVVSGEQAPTRTRP